MRIRRPRMRSAFTRREVTPPSYWIAIVYLFYYSGSMEIQDATSALAALGHATRLSIFRLLVEAGPEGRLAGDIAQTLSLPGATLSFHLKELSAAGLIRGESRSRYICYRADFDAMNGLIEFLTRNCCGGNRAMPCVPARNASAAAASRKAAKV